MTRYEAKEFDTFSYNGDIDYIKESSVSQRIDAIFDYFEKQINKEEKDCSTCYHLGDNDYCEYCIRGEGYSKDYWELKV